jgi:hypothetical protein
MSEELTIDDLLQDPKSFGAPTFEEYAKNPERWRKAADDIFAQVDLGSVLGLNKVVEKYRFKILNYKCDTLEEVEKVCKNEGWDIRKLEIHPEIVPLGGGKCDIEVTFKQSKKDMELMIEQAAKNALKTT